MSSGGCMVSKLSLHLKHSYGHVKCGQERLVYIVNCSKKLLLPVNQKHFLINKTNAERHMMNTRGILNDYGWLIYYIDLFIGMNHY